MASATGSNRCRGGVLADDSAPQQRSPVVRDELTIATFYLRSEYPWGVYTDDTPLGYTSVKAAGTDGHGARADPSSLRCLGVEILGDGAPRSPAQHRDRGEEHDRRGPFVEPQAEDVIGVVDP